MKKSGGCRVSRVSAGLTRGSARGYSASGWLLFSSPNFTANDTPAGGRYQVLTDPGQACQYRWNVGGIAGDLLRMKLTIRNTGVNPIVVDRIDD
jgi:hypothetical protein